MNLFEYESAHLDSIAQTSYLFDIGLRYTHSVLFSNDRSETNILRF